MPSKLKLPVTCLKLLNAHPPYKGIVYVKWINHILFDVKKKRLIDLIRHNNDPHFEGL